MLSAEGWTPNQPNTILFVLVNSSGNEVTGLGSNFVLQLSKAGGSFSASAGVKSEISFGWYKYISTAGEADTPGPIAVTITHASISNQNLEYVVGTRVETSVPFTYTLLSTAGGTPPIEGADIVIYTDAGATNFVWSGVTDTFGVARDIDGELPRLQPGSYFIFSYRSGFSFSNPDVEIVSV